MPFVAPIAAAAGSFMAANAGTIAAVSAATQVAGAGVSFLGSRQQAKAAKTAADYNSRILRNQSAEESTAAQESALRTQEYGRRVMGAQRAAMAQSGLAPSGTPLIQLGSTAQDIQREIFDIGRTADQRARALISEASMTRWQADQQASALNTSATTNLVGTLANTGFSLARARGITP